MKISPKQTELLDKLTTEWSILPKKGSGTRFLLTLKKLKELGLIDFEESDATNWKVRKL